MPPTALPTGSHDMGMAPLELLLLRHLRRRIIPYLDGRVLEIGAGTGINLPLYASSALVTALEYDQTLLRYASRRNHQAAVTLLQADARSLPLRDSCFDHAVSTLVMCSLPDPAAALQEIRRVLVPGGWLSMIEHVRGESGLARRLTDTCAAPWFRVTSTCRLDRETRELVSASGLQVVTAPRYAFGLVQIIIARKR